MTREEVTSILEESKRQNEIMRDNPSTFWASHQMAEGVKNAKRRIEALDIALSALRPVSREQIKKMKKEPVEGECDELYAPTYKCPECGFENIGKGNFCQNCGCLYTDEAVDMVMERMEKLHEDNGCS